MKFLKENVVQANNCTDIKNVINEELNCEFKESKDKVDKIEK